MRGIMVIKETWKHLARLELPQLCLNFLDISPVPFPDPSLGTCAPHLGATDGHAAALPSGSGWPRSERRPAVRQGGENELGWDILTEGAVDLVHLLAFCVRFLPEGEGIGGGGGRTHGKVIQDESSRSGNRAELGLYDTMVIRGDHNRIEVKDEGRGAVGILGAARHWHGVGGGQIYRG